MSHSPAQPASGLITEALASLTPDLPGIGGRIKERPEDFLVEEQPLRAPTGDGPYLMLYIEKRCQTTTDVVRRVAKMFRTSRSDVGYAGLKDKQAIARQHLTVRLPEGIDVEQCLSRFAFTPIRLLWSQRHDSPLHRGHLAGNRFVIYVRDTDPSRVLMARTVLDRLVAEGAPNYVGWQRFGYRQSNHRLGRFLLLRQWQAMLDELLGHPRPADSPATRAGRAAYARGDCDAALAVWPRQLRHDRQALDAIRQGRTAEEAVHAIVAQQREFLISALQSAIFNDVLDRRIHDGLLGTLLPGDLAWAHDDGSARPVDDATARHESGPHGGVRSLALSPSGPMWGCGMARPDGEPRAWEAEALARQDLTEGDFEQADHVAVRGSRRPQRVPVRDADIAGGADEHGPYVRVAFELPRGSFATVLMREIMKNDGTGVT